MAAICRTIGQLFRGERHYRSSQEESHTTDRSWTGYLQATKESGSTCEARRKDVQGASGGGKGAPQSQARRDSAAIQIQFKSSTARRVRLHICVAAALTCRILQLRSIA